MDVKTYKMLVISTISGYLSFLAYQKTGLLSAAFVLFGLSWILIHFLSKKEAWNFMGLFVTGNGTPWWALAIAGIVTFAYFAVRTTDILQVSLYTLGVGILAAVVSMWIFKYWHH